MSFILTDIGEEYLVDNGLNGVSVDVSLYNDATDTISDGDDLDVLTTEPSGSAFARQTDTVSTASLSGDYGFDNDSELTFDTSDSSQTVDGYFLVINFDSTVAGDGGTATDHLIATGALSQSRNLSDIDTLKISAGGVGVKVD